MQEKIVDPNKKDRNSLYAISAFVFAMGMVFFLINSDKPLALMMPAVGILTIPLASLERPYAVLSPDGVSVRLFLKKETLYRWSELSQAGIQKTDAKKGGYEYEYAMILLLPNGSRRHAGGDKYFTTRNRFRMVRLPPTKDIREYVTKYYGPLDFNDFDKLNDWEKKYYNFD